MDFAKGQGGQKFQNSYLQSLLLFLLFHHGNIFLMLQIGNLRINRDNSFRKLEHISQCVDKTIVTNQHIPASSRFKPAVTITAQQYGCS